MSVIGFAIIMSVHGIAVTVSMIGICISTCRAYMVSSPCGNISYQEPAYAGSSVHIKFEPSLYNNTDQVKWFISYNNGGWKESDDQGREFSKMFVLPFRSNHMQRIQGFYAAHIYNDSRSRCNSAQLTVIFEDNVYLVLNTATPRSLRPGDNLLLNCTVVGSQEATVDWARAGLNTESLGDPCGPMSSCLSLLNVTTNSTGNYTCIAKFEGENEISKTVHISVKDGIISEPADDTDQLLDPEEVAVITAVPIVIILLLTGVFVWVVVRRRRPNHSETTPLEECECVYDEVVPISSVSRPINDATISLTAHVVRVGIGYSFRIDNCTITPASSTEQYQHYRSQCPMLKY